MRRSWVRFPQAAPFLTCGNVSKLDPYQARRDAKRRVTDPDDHDGSESMPSVEVPTATRVALWSRCPQCRTLPYCVARRPGAAGPSRVAVGDGTETPWPP